MPEHLFWLADDPFDRKRSGGCPALVCCMTALSSARVTRSAFSYWPCFQEIPNGAVDTA